MVQIYSCINYCNDYIRIASFNIPSFRGVNFGKPPLLRKRRVVGNSGNSFCYIIWLGKNHIRIFSVHLEHILDLFAFAKSYPMNIYIFNLFPNFVPESFIHFSNSTGFQTPFETNNYLTFNNFHFPAYL